MRAKPDCRNQRRPKVTSFTEDQAKEKLVSDFNVSRETMDALEGYRLLIVKWAKQINLVGPSTLTHFWERHALDCAQMLPLAGPKIASLVDFGTGAGLPGLIIAALLKDSDTGCQITLVEASAKRCGFLREAARTIGVDVTILHEKIETVAPTPADIVTARAFAPLEKLLDYASPWMDLGARAIFFKGADVQSEIEQASTNWTFQSRINTSVTDSRGCVVEILNLRRR
jgi:16S rRNA (guanine527-N7)-methyltransferase